jgi:hypothetical protein
MQESISPTHVQFTAAYFSNKLSPIFLAQAKNERSVHLKLLHRLLQISACWLGSHLSTTISRDQNPNAPKIRRYVVYALRRIRSDNNNSIFASQDMIMDNQ